MSALLDSLARGALPSGDATRGARRSTPRCATACRSRAAKRGSTRSLRALERRAFAPSRDAGAGSMPRCSPASPAPRLVFVNGRFDAALSTRRPADGVRCSRCRIAAAPATIASELRSPVASSAPTRSSPRLNAALADDGVRAARRRRRAQSTRPCTSCSSAPPRRGDLAWHLRHLIESARRRRAAAGRAPPRRRRARAPRQRIAHVHLARGARADARARAGRSDAARPLFARTDAVLARDARYRRLDLELGAALSRHELNVALQGDSAHAACQRRAARRPAGATSTRAWASTTSPATRAAT